MQELAASDLIARCAEHDDARVWNEFERRYGTRIVGGIRRAYHRAGRPVRPDHVEDLRQEVYCRLLEKDRRALAACRGTTEGEVGAYLTRLSERITLDHLRHTAADCRDRSKAQPLTRLSPVHAPRIPPTGEQRLLARERLREFMATCRRVCRGSRRRDLELLRLALVEGLTSREISSRLGGELSVSGVDTRLSRLRQRLRRHGCELARRVGSRG